MLHPRGTLCTLMLRIAKSDKNVNQIDGLGEKLWAEEWPCKCLPFNLPSTLYYTMMESQPRS